jgi:carbon storage regulator
MLVLTRKVDEGVVLSGNIRVQVLAIKRGRVKIGISAPSDVEVLREELQGQPRETAVRDA